MIIKSILTSANDLNNNDLKISESAASQPQLHTLTARLAWYGRLSCRCSEGQVMGQQSNLPGPPSYLVGESSLFKSRSDIPDTGME